MTELEKAINMTKQSEEIFNIILDVINTVRSTNFNTDNAYLDSYLGGDFGIDSREMLEIWYEIEKKLDIAVHDYDKRDAYTIGDVVRIFEKQLLINTEA